MPAVHAPHWLRAGARLLLLPLLLLLLASGGACTTSNPGYVPDDRVDGGRDQQPIRDLPRPTEVGSRPERSTTRDLPRPLDQAPPPGKPKGVDVLIVVDNSVGMNSFQKWLGRDIDGLLGGLDGLPGGPSYRVAIVSTDVGVGAFANSNCTAAGDAGKLLLRPGCPQPSPGASWVQKIGGTANVGGDVKAALACLAELGEQGCGFEQPLEAMRQALAANPGFLRADAALAVVILTNEDDCSAQSQALYNAKDPALGPYQSYRCFQYGVLCNGQKPPSAPTLLQGCKPGQTWLHEVKSRYVDFLKGLKPAGWVSTLVLAAQPEQTTEVIQVVDGASTYWYLKAACQHSQGPKGDPAFRLQEFAGQLGPAALFSSICAASYTPALKGLVSRIQSAF